MRKTLVTAIIAGAATLATAAGPARVPMLRSYLGRVWQQLWLLPVSGGYPFPLTYGDYDNTNPRWPSNRVHLESFGQHRALGHRRILRGGRPLQIAERRYLHPHRQLRLQVQDETGRCLPARVSVTDSRLRCELSQSRQGTTAARARTCLRAHAERSGDQQSVPTWAPRPDPDLRVVLSGLLAQPPYRRFGDGIGTHAAGNDPRVPRSRASVADLSARRRSVTRISGLVAGAREWLTAPDDYRPWLVNVA